MLNLFGFMENSLPCLFFSHLDTDIRNIVGNSLAVQWLGLRASTAGAQVWSLFRELGSHKLRGQKKEKKGKKETFSKIGKVPQIHFWDSMFYGPKLSYFSLKVTLGGWSLPPGLLTATPVRTLSRGMPLGLFLPRRERTSTFKSLSREQDRE